LVQSADKLARLLPNRKRERWHSGRPFHEEPGHGASGPSGYHASGNGRRNRR